MVSISSIPFTELIIIALVYMAWGANKLAKYFESYVVLYFSLHTRGKTAVETAKKVVDRIAVAVIPSISKILEYYNLND